MTTVVPVLNAGSSSIKFAVRSTEPGLPLMLRGQVEAIGVAPKLTVKWPDGSVAEVRDFGAEDFDHATGTRTIIAQVRERLAGNDVAAIGHRVVHGGTFHSAPVRVDAAVLAQLETLIPLAPLHQPHNLAPIRTLMAEVPDIPQVACFDTAFHATQSLLARSFAIPRALTAEGVLRYGFHGLSYEFIARRVAEIAPHLASAKVVVAHLGNGSSLCAMQGGKSVATTMGFTAVEGLMMGTRCGSIDPGVLIWLMDEKGMDARAIERFIYKDSGLLGVSGISPDMRMLRESAAPEAREATDLFVYRIAREIGSMAAALGGLDALVFTAGIGENDAQTRAEIVARCNWLGLSLDEQANARGAERISPDGAKVEAWVIPTDEEQMIAEHTLSLLGRT
jgi:acetate kinase